MDEVFARRDMIAPARLKALTVKSDFNGSLQLGQPSRRHRRNGRRALADLGKLARHSLLRRAWRADQLPLRRPARVQPRDGVRDQEAQRDFWPAVRFRAALPARLRSDPAFRPSPLYPELGEGRRIGPRPLYARLLSAVGAGADLLVHPRAPHPALRFRHRDRALYSRRPKAGRDPRGALARRRLSRHRRALPRRA